MLALVDCNNFYASCERVFRPDLRGKPIVVLSNNDGCLIARSAEAKALGYKMGEAFFQAYRRLDRDKVFVFSSNYALYGDMSARVMRCLEQFTPLVDVYSIDEAFLDLSGFDNLDTHSWNIKRSIEQWTGIPVSVGVAPTKTLAKLANRIAKKWPGKDGVFVLEGPDEQYLRKIEVGDVWGIGRQLSKQLVSLGVDTALDLAQLDPRLVRQKFSVVVERTVRELQGIPCIEFDEAPPHPQNIMVSRGFKNRVREKRQLHEAVALYASRAGEKARGKNVFATSITVFLRTSPFAPGPKYSNSATITYPEAVNDTPALIKAATQALDMIFRSGLDYQKADIMLTGLVYENERQTSLFTTPDTSKKEGLMAVMDKLNNLYGSETLRMASSGTNRPWWMARERLSPSYTTRWSDLARVVS